MAHRTSIPVFKTNPFIRLILPLAAGILVQWHGQLTLPFIALLFTSSAIAWLLFGFLPLAFRFKLAFIQGVFIHVLLFAAGLLTTYLKDIRHTENWYGHHMSQGDYIVATINEPVTEKSKTYKAEVAVTGIIHNNEAVSCNGKMLAYFTKDSTAAGLQYGDEIIIHKDPQRIKNSGNPGAFDYEKYAAMQQLYHNVFVKEQDYTLLHRQQINPLRQFIFWGREKILLALRKNIGTGKDELGIAEALLIGYTNDLDKDLVQAYSNTGVVHIIAISGMHLGLIYVLLVWLFARIPGVKKSKWLQLILILAALWLFSLLTGASASVLRSAVMFTFISAGKVISRRSSMYNSLAASAFVLLCYNPFYLWDVGFQLSYLAVGGIVALQKPIYHVIFIKNKWLNKIWELTSVTLAAQVLTMPVCLYYFHQFPTLFLFTNLIAVPLSTIILFAEIALVALAWIPFLGHYMGILCGWLVQMMNNIITWFNHFSFSVWDQIPATLITTWLMYAVVVAVCVGLLQKNKRGLFAGLLALLAFATVQSYYKWQTGRQQKMIVYNVPRQQAMDFVQGQQYCFIGDSILLADAMLQNFHLKPARIALQLRQRANSLTTETAHPPFYQFGSKRILVIDHPFIFETTTGKMTVDIIILSKNPGVHIEDLVQSFNCNEFVADASNSLWKIGQWKKDCEQLHLHLHSVPEDGAFITDL